MHARELSMDKPSELAREILAYLVDHPEAKDTLEGIVEWWLLRQQIERRVEQARIALAELVECGFIVERKGKDGRSMYLVNHSKMNEIRQFIQKNGNSEKESGLHK
jgi:predicted transcriptional regulator